MSIATPNCRPNVRGFNPAYTRAVAGLFQRPGVAIAGRDGTLVQSGATGSTALHPTTGAVVSAGSLISHNLAIPGVGTLPMSFAQGARTNICLRSQEFNNGSWTLDGLFAFGSGSVANAAAAPDGTTTAERIVEDTTGSTHRVRQAFTITSSTAYTASVYAKAETKTIFALFASSGATSYGLGFNLADGSTFATTGATSAIIFTHYPSWWRMVALLYYIYLWWRGYRWWFAGTYGQWSDNDVYWRRRI